MVECHTGLTGVRASRCVSTEELNRVIVEPVRGFSAAVCVTASTDSPSHCLCTILRAIGGERRPSNQAGFVGGEKIRRNARSLACLFWFDHDEARDHPNR